MRKIKIAQIGINKLSHHLEIFNTLKNNSDVFDFVGYALPENEEQKYPEECACLIGVPRLTSEEILNDPTIEAVAIETDEVHLTKYALLAAKHDKHIHMEKPGGADLCEFEKLISEVKARNLTFHTGYMYRYNPCVKELIQKAKSGYFGKISAIEAHMSCCHRPENRKWLESLPGGMMFFLGCHLIDIVLQIKGEPLEIIPLNASSGFDGTRFNDIGMAVMKYADGSALVKTSAVEIGGFARRHIVVSGERCTAELSPLEMFEGEGLYTNVTEYSSPFSWGDVGTTTKSDIYDRYNDMLLSFAAMVRGEMQNPISYDYELMLYKTILKCI